MPVCMYTHPTIFWIISNVYCIQLNDMLTIIDNHVQILICVCNSDENLFASPDWRKWCRPLAYCFVLALLCCRAGLLLGMTSHIEEVQRSCWGKGRGVFLLLAPHRGRRVDGFSKYTVSRARGSLTRLGPTNKEVQNKLSIMCVAGSLSARRHNFLYESENK